MVSVEMPFDDCRTKYNIQYSQRTYVELCPLNSLISTCPLQMYLHNLLFQPLFSIGLKNSRVELYIGTEMAFFPLNPKLDGRLNNCRF